MRRRRRNPAQELRLAVECLPAHTKRAMLEGIRTHEIIIGAYTDRHGRVCPMLAAHRCGGRTSFISFARAWDRYTGARGRPQKATRRQLLTLEAMLEASLAREERWDLATVIAEHEELKRRMERERAAAAAAERERERDRRPTGERDRARELARRPGWAWLRPFRRYDDFEAALAWLGEAEREAAERERVAPERELVAH